MPQTRRCVIDIPVRFSKPPAEILRSASRVGENPEEWVIENIAEAVWEILFFSSNPAAYGVHLMPLDHEEDVFRLCVTLDLDVDMNPLLHAGRGANAVAQTCIDILTGPTPPLDHGIEVSSIKCPTSCHEEMASLGQAMRAYTAP